MFIQPLHMSLYDDGTWSAPGRPYWQQPPTPSRSGASTLYFIRMDGLSDKVIIGASSIVSREDASAFSFQFEGTSFATV